MDVHAFFDEPTATLSYVVWDPQSLDAAIIDPVLDFDALRLQTRLKGANAILDFVREHELKVHAVLETHAHADHLSGAQYLAKNTGAFVAIGARIREVQSVFRELLALDDSLDDAFDRLLGDGEEVKLGTLSVKTLATPGHTPACVSYLVGDALFTGDALFMDDYGTGRTDFPGGSAKALYASIQRLYALPDDTRVFVGHDYRPGGRTLRFETTIGASKANNPQLSADTDEASFIALRNTRDATLAPPRLLWPSLQVNIRGGRLPAGARPFLKLPLNRQQPTDDIGVPIP